VALNSLRTVIFRRHAVTPVNIYRRVFAVAAGWKLAFCYCRAAQRDEKNGFPFTAAMEWRISAELFHFVPMARQCCWGEWERIMRLPRRFATPIFEGSVMVCQDRSASNRSKMSTAGGKAFLSGGQRELGKERGAATLEISWRNPVPPRKVQNSVQKVAIKSKNDGVVYLISRSNREEEFELLDGGLATSVNRASAILPVMPSAAP